MAFKKQFSSPAVQYLYDKHIGHDPKQIASYERCAANSRVGQHVYDLRVGAKLTRQQLAEKVGTTRSVIRRVEEADHDGNAFAILRRVAAALGRRVELSFPVDEPTPKPDAAEAPAGESKA